jgi:hypothetical protein
MFCCVTIKINDQDLPLDALYKTETEEQKESTNNKVSTRAKSFFTSQVQEAWGEKRDQTITRFRRSIEQFIDSQQTSSPEMEQKLSSSRRNSSQGDGEGLKLPHRISTLSLNSFGPVFSEEGSSEGSPTLPKTPQLTASTRRRLEEKLARAAEKSNKT